VTSRERVQAALRHESPDRTPYFEYLLLSPVADKLLGRRYAGDPVHWDGLLADVGWENAVRRSAADRLDLAAVLGHDLIFAFPTPPPEGDGTRPPVFSARADADAGDDPVRNVEARLRALAAEPAPSDETFRIYEILKEEMRQRDMDLPILAPAYRHGVWTNVDLMQTMVLAPEVAHRHFGVMTEKAVAAVEKYAALGIDQVAVGGDFSGSRPLISPEAYRTFIMPEVARVSRSAHAHGMVAVNASDGDLWPVIDEFLIGCEVDGYLEIDQFAGMDLRRLKQQYGAQTTFYGNLDCGNMLTFGSPDEIKRHVVECLEAGMGNGGHILCASNAITASVPLENYLASVHAYRDFFSLPRLRS